MHPLFEPMQRPQPAIIDLRNAPDFKHILRAHAHAVCLTLTPLEIHDRADSSRLLLAARPRLATHPRFPAPVPPIRRALRVRTSRARKYCTRSGERYEQGPRG